MGERADVMREYRRPGDPDWVAATGESAEAESPEELRAEIAQTRTEMSGTIDAIQERLNPDRLKEQVTDAVHEQIETVKGNIREATVGRAEQMVSNVGETAQRAGSGFMETVKQNPIPAALVALGIGWLWMKRSDGSSYSADYRGDYRADMRGGYTGGPTYYAGGRPAYGRGAMYGTAAYGYGRGQEYYGGSEEEDASLRDRVGDMTGQAREKVGDVTGQAKEKLGDVTGQVTGTVTDAASQAKERVSQFADQAQDQFGEWGGQVQYGAQQAKWRFDQTLHENPLAVGAAAVAVGLAVGLSLPKTPVEDRLMGEARDNVFEKAQAAAQETMQKVGQVAQQVQQTATETAKDAAQKQGLMGGSSDQEGTPPKQQDTMAKPQTPQSASATAANPQAPQGTAANMPKSQTQQSTPSQPTTK